jgi:thioredoxin reductase
VPGLYIAGELGGMGLIRNAVEQGRQALRAMKEALPKNAKVDWDIVIIGAGPAGIAASLAAKEAGIRCVTIDQADSLGGTVAHFPRGKLVMTQPAVLPLVGKVKFTETSKEQLLEFWQQVIEQHPLNIEFGHRLEKVTPLESGFEVHTQKQRYRCSQVLLAIGRRGTPRQLGVEGEELTKVVYRLIDPEQYQRRSVLVVGGGDSALEAAASIAEQSGSQVTLTYRGDAFSRAKPKNRVRIEALQSSGQLNVLLSTSPIKIEQKRVHLKTSDQTLVLENDDVIICAGGVLPSGLLKEIGITMETKYGEA